MTAEDKPELSDCRDGVVELDKEFVAGEKIGVLTCSNAGVKTDVYFGGADVVLGRGAAVKPDYALFGEGEAVFVDGLSSVAFTNIDSIVTGDLIEVATEYGRFEYVVIDGDFESTPADLVLCANRSRAPFANAAVKRYVLANMVSGPKLVKGEVLSNEP